MTEASSTELRDTIRTHAPATTVSRLAASGVQRCRVIPMDTLETLFQKALERALERSLARLPSPARQSFEKDAREELRELVREELAARAAREPADEGISGGRQGERDPLSERKRGLLELVFQENLVLQKRTSAA